jgi:hypothetical protein
MRPLVRSVLLLALAVSSVSAARGKPARKPPAPVRAAPPAAEAAPLQRGPTRLDFTDPRLITGQLNSGAVYLYERKELKGRSMVKLREDFRDELDPTRLR